jgi:hypothetical protein
MGVVGHAYPAWDSLTVFMSKVGASDCRKRSLSLSKRSYIYPQPPTTYVYTAILFRVKMHNFSILNIGSCGWALKE